MFLVLLVVTLLAAADAQTWHHATFTAGASMLGDFHTESVWGQEALDVVADPHGGTAHVLRIHYDKGSYSETHNIDRGSGFYAHPIAAHDSMFFSYDIYFAPNFDFVKGGKLPGLWGGSTTCSGGRHSDNCFTTRFMWREGGAGEVYAYIPHDQQAGFCDRSDVDCNFDYGNSLGRGKWHFRKGVWQNIAQYVHLNTPGQHDGYIRVFLDGKMVYEIRNVVLRIKGTVHIDGFYFVSFFGGSDSSWASTQSTYTYYKNLMLSSSASTPIVG